MGIITVPFTIANGATNSAAIDIRRQLPVGILVDPNMASTTCTFMAGFSNPGSVGLISDGQGNSYTYTFRAGDYLPLNPSTFAGCEFLYFIAGSSEGALRNLTLVCVTN